MTTRYHCERAWLGGEGVQRDVAVTVEGSGIAAVQARAVPGPGDVRLSGLVLPGFANAHSHAFHRALRGRAERGAGDFWVWREVMYEVAGALGPDSYRELATAVYAEMALAGVTAVGEFHYLHHAPGGRHYRDRNEMGLALIEAGNAAGVRVTLVDTCYLEAAPGRSAEGAQQRFSDGSAEAWASRVEALVGDGARVAAGIHSARAVPPRAAAEVASWARRSRVPLHFHLAEQPAEVKACIEAYGARPVALLEEAGALGDGSWAVHATHLEPAEVSVLARSGTGACLCPTTEADLADGIGPAAALADAGVPLCLGTDSHALIDPFVEMRDIELDQRLATGRRGHLGAAALLAAGTETGHLALGAPDDGRIAVGATADLVAVSTDGPALAGWEEDCLAESVVFAASRAEVTHVVAGGRLIVADGAHLLVGDVGTALDMSIRAVMADAR